MMSPPGAIRNKNETRIALTLLFLHCEISAVLCAMHGSAGLHSALAIKRQRRLREQAKRRALERDRRLSSSTNSIDSGEHRPVHKTTQSAPSDHRLATSIGMLHLGVCFLVLGIFLIGSGLLPDDVVTWRGGGWWNELLATGLFVVALGVFLISLNRVMSKKEEDDLNEYVQRQLTRSRSGHRLERDVETGCLTTKNHRRYMEKQREDKERGLSDEELPQVHSPNTKTNSPNNFVYQNGDAHLERILEEEVFERTEEDGKRAEYECLNKESISTTTTASLSPGTPSETRELLSNGRHHQHSTRI
ncbi:hypothetical protein ILUMI_10403 [Ignelater luminosus]|uniref:Uncharacterized protein n=1 Tax=Ignelater luminosus TaxID=2038154 RepID=A0A8K0D2H6_IGNLU|nr:hypothetical protein ILUMI_10403 [Ignelater luminosus]